MISMMLMTILIIIFFVFLLISGFMGKYRLVGFFLGLIGVCNLVQGIYGTDISWLSNIVGTLSIVIGILYIIYFYREKRKEEGNEKIN